MGNVSYIAEGEKTELDQKNPEELKQEIEELRAASMDVTALMDRLKAARGSRYADIFPADEMETHPTLSKHSSNGMHPVTKPAMSGLSRIKRAATMLVLAALPLLLFVFMLQAIDRQNLQQEEYSAIGAIEPAAGKNTGQQPSSPVVNEQFLLEILRQY